ncbi:hypothetical protein CONCODRAFT_80242 [Conidiobolus coronatus NRRL 28638]|uniref:C3H1-type domain-containing protein n=1 Tax=Conidiobolus coronatus (strain ATCC 28846 / CBS 209.66 / NRRL 28638) TaxID=796925 RepID=A0A137NX79_CONC2|nr:hypothetical protein CONCODRAFT_80242 [Conidiobolus coronatus NRRL 28638]|eukprot:KXN67254.1 hypothetical protein CONCODRAFT_80242 [Conidiobolus coronatus NRRL 28638]
MGLNITSTTVTSNIRQSSTLCNFYLTPEGCKFGKKCQFVHLDTNFYTTISAPLPSSQIPQAPAIKTVPCKFFMKGKCKYGNDCRFLHNFIRFDGSLSGEETLSEDDNISEASFYSSENPPSLTQTDDLGSVSELSGDELTDDEDDLLNEVYQFNLEFNGGSLTAPLDACNVITICNYHLRNKCKFGDQCRNKHISGSRVASPTNNTSGVTPTPSPLAAKYFFEYEKLDWGSLLEDALSQPIVGATSTVQPSALSA